MDGGRRVLRSIKESLTALLPLAPMRPALAGSQAGLFDPYAVPYYPQKGSTRVQRPARRRIGNGGLERVAAFATRPGFGSALVIALFTAVGLAGFVQNGGYRDLVVREGEPYDIVARAVGFPIRAVTISGQKELSQADVLASSGVGPRNSLLFLDPAAVRQRVMALPLVKTARVLKLFPDRLVIAIEERQPHALWQRAGHVSVVSSDGAVVDELRDDRFLGLPFVVGEGAQKRLAEFDLLRAALGDLASRLKAGVLVAERRWNLMMTNGVEVKLPEQDPGAALAILQQMKREARVLDKDILSVDLRVPGRVTVRLTEEGAANRVAVSTRKPVKSGG
jgi:cell division protein FtsQ